jgi:hypothetical protein
VIRRAALAIVALLGTYHAWLFGRQALSGELSDPATGLRWIVAALLVAGLVILRRRGESMRGSPAVAVWVLAALLHGPALADGVDRAVPAVPEVVVIVSQAAAVAAIGLAWLLWVRLVPWAPGAAFGLLAPVDGRMRPARAPARRLRCLPRPPPLA